MWCGLPLWGCSGHGWLLLPAYLARSGPLFILSRTDLKRHEESEIVDNYEDVEMRRKNETGRGNFVVSNSSKFEWQQASEEKKQMKEIRKPKKKGDKERKKQARKKVKEGIKQRKVGGKDEGKEASQRWRGKQRRTGKSERKTERVLSYYFACLFIDQIELSDAYKPILVCKVVSSPSNSSVLK